MDHIQTVQCISTDEDGSDEDNTWDAHSDSKNIVFVSKRKPRAEAESSTANSYLVAHVTSSNLSRDRLCILRNFARSTGLNERSCEIDLMNEHGKSWTLSLRYNRTTDQACIRGGWRNFCLANGLEAGSFYKFKLVRNGTRPLLRLCSDTIPEGSSSKGNGKDNPLEKPSSECLKSALMKQNKFLTLTFKPYMLQSGQLRFPRHFARENGIKEAGEITLVDKSGLKCPSYIASCQGGFYIAKGWRRFVASSRLETGDTFTLEFVREEGTIPMLKFFSMAKVKIEQAPFNVPRGTVQASQAQEETVTRIQKRARVSGSDRCTADKGTEKQKLPFQPCSITDQVATVKQSIVDVLTSLKEFRCELEIKEHTLGVSLQEIDALGEKISEINKIFNSNKI